MKILFKIIKAIITVFLLVVLSLVIFQKVTKNKLVVGNIYVFQVVSESMIPDYKIGDIVVVKKVNPEDLKIGDDVTYLGRESNLAGLTITHRIISLRKDNNEYYFTTKGTANAIEDPEITSNDIYGKVIYKTMLFSFVGRLMTNIVIYYLLFVSVGVGFAYEVITAFFIKDDNDEEEKENKD